MRKVIIKFDEKKGSHVNEKPNPPSYAREIRVVGNGERRCKSWKKILLGSMHILMCSIQIY